MYARYHLRVAQLAQKILEKSILGNQSFQKILKLKVGPSLIFLAELF